MSLILGVDTSNENSCVVVHNDEQVLFLEQNFIKSTHVKFIHTAIERALKDTNINVNQIDAFSIINGPGSYTGLRIGLSTLKGLCYASKKPLIALNTLDILANIIQPSTSKNIIFSSVDARENEVFGALYKSNYDYLVTPNTLLLDESLNKYFTANHSINLIGNASEKIMKTYNHTSMNIITYNYHAVINSFIKLSFNAFKNNKFTNSILLEPFYLKQAYIK